MIILLFKKMQFFYLMMIVKYFMKNFNHFFVKIFIIPIINIKVTHQYVNKINIKEKLKF